MSLINFQANLMKSCSNSVLFTIIALKIYSNVTHCEILDFMAFLDKLKISGH